MHDIRHRPLLCGVVGFVLGIGVWGMGAHSFLLAFAGALVGLGLLLTARPALGLAGLVLAGMALGALRLALFQTRTPTDVSRWADSAGSVLITGLVDSDPDVRLGRTSFTLRAERIQSRGQVQAATGQCIVNLPGTIQSLDYGERVTLDGLLETPPRATNPGAFSWREALARRGIYAVLHVRRPQAVQMLGPAASNPVLRLAWHVRHYVLRGIRGGLPPEQAAVLGGILIGQRTDLPPDLLSDFVRTGTVHLLASAGLHVGIIALCLLWIGRHATLPHKVSALLLMGTLGMYALVCGGRPGAVRAVVVAVVFLGAGLCERLPDGPTTLGAAAGLILFLQPTALWESGFQLSFLVVLTLVVGMPLWSAFWHPCLERRFTRPLFRKAAVWALDLCGLSILAQIGALPIVARDFNLVSLVGVPANLLAVPALFWVIPLGFAGALLWPLLPGVGAALLWLCHFGLAWIVHTVQMCAAPPWAAIVVSSPTTGLIVAYYLVLAMCALALRRSLLPREQFAPAATPSFAR